MKHQKLWALVLAAIMAFTLAVPALAGEPEIAPDEPEEVAEVESEPEVTAEYAMMEVSADEYCTVTFDHGDGTTEAVQVPMVNDPHWGKIGTLTAPETPVRADQDGVRYEFLKWTCDGRDFFDENGSATVTRDLTVTAMWTEYLVEGYEVLATYPDGSFQHLTGTQPIQTLVEGASGYYVQPVQRVVRQTRNSDPEAKIGDSFSGTLAEVVDQAKDNDTITLEKDIPLTESVKISKNITIDLNGKTITGNGSRVLDIQSGTVVLTGTGTLTSTQGGSFSSSSSVIRVGTNDAQAAKATLTVDPGVTVSSTYCYGITVFGTNQGTEAVGQELVLNGEVTVSGENNAISGNGNSTNSKTSITINTGALVTSTNSYAIYHPQSGTLTVNGGTISGKGGIEAKSGTVVINGGNVVATDSTTGHNSNGNGTSTSGYALAAVENSAYKGGVTFTISGGTFTGTVDVENGSDATISITNGTFSTQPAAAYLAAGNVATGSGDTWTISAKTPLAQAKDLAAVYVTDYYNKYSKETIDTPADYYIKVSGTTTDYSFLNDIGADQTFSLSIGNYSYITDKFYKQQNDGLYIAFPVILFEQADETQTLTFSSVQSEDDSVLRVDGKDGEYTLTHDSLSPATKYMKLAIEGIQADGKYISKKVYHWTDGTTAVNYGFSKVDNLGSGSYGIAYYAFGWNETQVSAGWDGVTTEYYAYSVGQGKTGKLTFHQKVECFHNYSGPVWSWRRINGTWAALATFTCSRSRCYAEQVVPASISESTSDGTVTTTATATFNGQNYTDQKTEARSYTVTFNGSSNSYKWGELCTLTYDTENTPMKWYINDNLVADGRGSYTFAVTEKSTVTTDTTTETTPVAVISSSLTSTEANKAVFNVKWSLPTNAEVVSAIIYRGKTSTDKDILSSVLISKGTQYNTRLLVRNGDFTLNISGLTPSKWQHVVIDITYKIGNVTHHLISGTGVNADRVQVHQ